MTDLWSDGPDHYGTDASLMAQGAYAQANGFVGLTANAGPGGVGTVVNMTVNGVAGVLRWVAPGHRSLLAYGTRYFYSALPAASSTFQSVFQWRDDANTSIADLRIISTGAIQLWFGATLIVQTAPVIVAQSWQHIECKLKFGSAGAYQINVNSLEVVSADNVPIGTDANYCSQVAWVNDFRNVGYQMRDLYLWDDQGTANNTMHGDREVTTGFTTADGPEQDWSYSAGSAGWPLINNNPPIDTDFVFSDSSGQLSDFETQPIDTEITSITSVRIAARAFKSDAGIGTLSLGMVSGSAKSPVVEQSLSTEAIYYSQMVELDPNTGTRWTATTRNAALVELNRVQ